MINFFAKHPTAANLLMLIICLLGLHSLTQLKRETFAEFQTDKILVTAIYPGASPSEVEQTVCLTFEDAIEGVNAIASISCEARENIANMTVEVAEGALSASVMRDVKTQIDAIDSLPSLVEKPIVLELGQDQHLISLAITADIPEVDLRAYALQFKHALKKLPGISTVELTGFSDPQLKVFLATELLRQYGLSAKDVVNLIKKQNINLPLGDIQSDEQALSLRFAQQQLSVEALGQLVIKSTVNGEQVYLKDIATLADGFEFDEEKIIFDGKRAALLDIKKAKSQDAITLVNTVTEFVQLQQAIAPQGVQLVLSQNTANVIEDRLAMLIDNGWQGFILVFLVMYLFFSIRYSFWVSMGLPVSFLGSFALMVWMGVSINMISMVALLMSIGILMDDAIVIAESIAAKVEKGHSIEQGVIEGVNQVASGVFSSFLTTFVVFIGLAFISGDIGKVLKDIPLVLIATITVSVIEAFFILPNHLLHSLKHQSNNNSPEPKFKTAFVAMFERFRCNQLVTVVSWVVINRYRFIGGVLALFLLSVTLVVSGGLKFKAFPDLEGDILEVRLLLPASTPLNQTEIVVNKYVTALERAAVSLNEKEELGAPLVKHISVLYNKNSDAFEQGSHVATIRVDLLTAELRHNTMAAIKAAWQSEVGSIAGITSVSFKEPTLGPAGRAIEIRLHAQNLDHLMQAGAKLKAQLAHYDGVNNILDDLRIGKEEWNIRLLPGALAYGVDGQMVSAQLRSAFFGEVADEIQRNTDTVEIFVQLQAQDKERLAQLKNYPIILADGSQHPLSALAELTAMRGVTRLNRVDGERTLTITADVDTNLGNTNEIVTQLQRTVMVDIMAQWQDISVSYEGEIKNGGQTGKSIGGKFLLGLIGIFVILSFQFRSYFEPIMVMIAIPLALIGVLWGHWLLGYDISMPSMIGFVSLAGIVVNDSILLVAYIKEHQQQGMDIHQSAVMAAKERFRAIFITSATTIAGTVPLLLESSLQAQVVQPLVVSIIFGMIVSTLLILLVLPAFYVLLNDLSLTSKHHLTSEPIVKTTN
ncbi:efflux RND transporter permease subunit [Pseudoalteromonas tunicata]|uniref:efflux RND transporter permease subunit n=1 Tax=Pseudoalteromonas tunicata TaxID=314281 RepID=UPI002740279B|nr:efflux RND transporter permease subunit [Pseudoalteromonas tunicata]MDP5214749.1 efflux RND transporter permease subunit [Pseudoalteromonas tunicata]